MYCIEQCRCYCDNWTICVFLLRLDFPVLTDYGGEISRHLLSCQYLTIGLTRHTADARSLMNIILLLKDPLISQASPRLSGGALVGLNLVSFSAVRERARKEQSSGMIATGDREGVMGGSEENPLIELVRA